MPYYTFTQNNSGGSFDHDHNRGIGYVVCIHALTADHANHLAEEKGLYFDGCATGIDCDCCGDRWSRADESDGYAAPGMYGEDDPIKGGWGISSYIHRLNGSVEEVPCKEGE